MEHQAGLHDGRETCLKLSPGSWLQKAASPLLHGHTVAPIPQEGASGVCIPHQGA